MTFTEFPGEPAGAELPLVVITGQVPVVLLDDLRRRARVRVWSTPAPAPRDQLETAVRGAAALVTMLYDPVDAALLDAAGEGLALVANLADGVDNVDLEAALLRGVTVTNTPGVLTEATADLTMALLLAAARRIGESERLVRAGTPWSFQLDFMLGVELNHATLGIVGMGKIGRAVARRAEAFGMRVQYVSRNADAALSYKHAETLEDLLATSDVVSLHCPLTPATHHLITAERFALMRPHAIVINTARGPIIDEVSLVKALRHGQIGAAGLDVFEHEPRIDEQLMSLENVTLTPHIGSATVAARTAMMRLAIANVTAYLVGEPPRTPVTPATASPVGTRW